MITKEEWSAVKLSATKKDFYQIWNELLDIASKLSYRWDPQNTNESDPGIVLLKVLTAVADKLNYNIDVNSLEAYMPSAAQEESMRKLTEMLGYNMKYYQSAVTKVRFSYLLNTGDNMIPAIGLELPRFTNVKDLDDTVNYVTLEPCTLSPEVPVGTVNCIEGELVECESDDDNIISVLQLDDNNRYYLPELSIAENGIFVNNIMNERLSQDWDKVDNLNAQILGTHCFKFGFDSKENRPYIQFPDDIANIIEDGLRIKYIRTNGINGNVAVKVLQKFEKPIEWNDKEEAYYNPDNYAVANNAAATSGCNPELMADAYNNYKKTIGTFETLVACRDYMNKIYNLTVSDTDTRPLVSNIIVTDIRSDINKAYTLCTFGEHGIEYKNVAKDYDTGTPKESKPTTQNELKALLGKYYTVAGSKTIYTVIHNGNEYEAVEVSGKKLDHFDLIFYPFTATNNVNNKLEYVKSFKYDDSTILEIKNALEDTKTVSHNIILPDKSEIACIKDYYTLNVKIVTIRKVNIIEQKSILDNVYTALFKAFNMRKLDFGEEIVEDQIQTIIKEADPRIKDILWNSPLRTMKVCAVNGSEYDLATTTGNSETNPQGKLYYNKLALNNILAGKVPLFNYDTNFKPEFNEVKYPGTQYQDIVYPKELREASAEEDTLGVSKITSKFIVNSIPSAGLKLNKNEFIQFRLPNLKTVKTYPAYVNYFLKLKFSDTDPTVGAKAASMIGLEDFLVRENCKPTLSEHPELFDSNDNLVMNAENTAAWNTYLAGLNRGWSTSIYYYKIKENNPDKAAGYLVDDVHNVYVRLPKFIQQSNINQYFIPYNKDASEEVRVSTNYLGEDGKASKYLETNEEYQLQKDEYLLFNYTHATSTDSEGKTVVNEYYGEGTIIRPNFKLYDSEYYRTLHGYNKTEGYDFSKWNLNPPGLFTLASSEQIEIRKFIEITLNEDATNIYWTRQDEASLLDDETGKVSFEFDEEPVYKANWSRVPANTTFNAETMTYSAYTLKSGEYFYYTDKDFTDLAWYGSGTKITRHKGTPAIYKLKSENNISVDDIASNGLAASIPWRSYSLNDLDTENKKSLLLTEYQYKNLSEGDTLISIELKEQNTNLNETWQECKAARYQFEEADSGDDPLPPVSFTTLYWEVRSGLIIDINPNVAQVLNVTKTDTTADNVTTSIIHAVDMMTVTYKNLNGTPTDLVVIPQVDQGNLPVAIKANKLIQSTNGFINLKQEKENEEGTLVAIYDTQVKIFNAAELKDSDNTNLSINNFNSELFTKITISDKLPAKATGEAAKQYVVNLNAVIPSGDFGLIMFHCDKLESGLAPQIYLKGASGDIVPVIFNKGSWWSDNEVPSGSAEVTGGYIDKDTTAHKTYQLRKGINIIQLTESCEIKIVANNETADITSTVIFGNLDLIKAATNTDPTLPLNSKILYNAIDENKNAYEQILADIKLHDPEYKFYYNAFISNEDAIDITNDETLADPAAWHSYNNANNSFVISEISAEGTGLKGIEISKNSKL